VEVWQRYLVKQNPIPEITALQNEPGDRVRMNLEAIGEIQTIARETNSQFLLVMTPLRREIGAPGPRNYEITARQRLSDFAKAQQISYVDVLPVFNSHKNPQALYQDHIHLNLQGNQLVNQLMVRSLLDMLGQSIPQNGSAVK
jgi:lysophospholipase L1-like esterase